MQELRLAAELVGRASWRGARAGGGRIHEEVMTVATRSSADVVNVGGQRDVDVCPCGIRARTHLMRGSNDPRRRLRILNLRQD